MDKQKFYITTAIAYASRKPHIGNAYDIVLADMIARYKKMMGFDVYLMTGSDEHGQKIENLANDQGITPKAYVDGVAGEIRTIWDLMNSSSFKCGYASQTRVISSLCPGERTSSGSRHQVPAINP